MDNKLELDTCILSWFGSCNLDVGLNSGELLN